MPAQQADSMVDRTIDRIHADSQLKEAGFVMPAPHCHPHCELFYIESGCSSFFVDGDMYDLHEGDFMLLPPQIFHYTRYPSGACRRSNVFFRKEDVDGETAQLLPGGAAFLDSVRIFRLPPAYAGQVGGILSAMVREERINDGRTAMMMVHLLRVLLLLCSRECEFLQELPRDIHTTDAPIVRAAKFISERYADDITMADIAAAAGYSPNYLSKKFRLAAGIGVHEYLIFTRLQRAALELVSTDHSVTDIALRCGFSDGNYFKDAFKKKYGVTPREYRR